MKHRKDKPENPIEVRYWRAKRERDQLHFYRNLVLRSVSTFFISMILLAFLEADGLGAFLFALVLCLFSMLFAKSC